MIPKIVSLGRQIRQGSKPVRVTCVSGGPDHFRKDSETSKSRTLRNNAELLRSNEDGVRNDTSRTTRRVGFIRQRHI